MVGKKLGKAPACVAGFIADHQKVSTAVPISRTIREQVTRQIRDEVIAGALAPDVVLRETDLARRFGVSRGPIREALADLEHACIEGYETAVKRCDFAFHEAILLACQGDSFLSAWKQLCSRMALTYERLSDLNHVFLEHKRILDGIELKDLPAVPKALKENIL